MIDQAKILASDIKTVRNFSIQLLQKQIESLKQELNNPEGNVEFINKRLSIRKSELDNRRKSRNDNR